MGVVGYTVANDGTRRQALSPGSDPTRFKVGQLAALTTTLAQPVTVSESAHFGALCGPT